MMFDRDKPVKIYESRQNQVMLVRDSDGKSNVIVKKYRHEASWKTETQVLTYLNQHDLPVPQIIRAEPLKLYLSLLPGITACEYIEQCEVAGKDIPLIYLEKTVALMGAIYSTALFSEKNLILGDANWRNIIISEQDQTMYRVDFESVRAGNIIEEAGSLVAFLLTYTPVLSRIKMSAADMLQSLLSQHLNIHIDLLSAAICSQLEIIDRRRGTNHLTAYKTQKAK